MIIKKLLNKILLIAQLIKFYKGANKQFQAHKKN